MTAEELERLRSELDHLRTEGRRRTREELAKALSFGDYSENAELDEAKRAYGILEGRIADLTILLGRAELVEPGTDSRVTVGTVVTATDLETMESVCFRVGVSVDSQPGDVCVTPDSPVGRALMGKSVSDEVEVQTPSGTCRYRIGSLSLPEREV
jgi:transcription elongation factor GreA